MTFRHACLAACLALPTTASADFVSNNALAIFYHELGHAIIHQMEVPIFGQEEDAADTLSILLIDAFYEEDSALSMAYDSAALFWAEAEEPSALWGTHGPAEQRYYNTVCLFYGADADGREDFAEELELPEERAIGCEEEFELAAGSWHAVLDDMNEDETLEGQLVLVEPIDDPVLRDEVAALNAEFRWPQDVTVRIEECGDANAFYDLEEVSVTMCTELYDWITDVGEKIGAL